MIKDKSNKPFFNKKKRHGTFMILGLALYQKYIFYQLAYLLARCKFILFIESTFGRSYSDIMSYIVGRVFKISMGKKFIFDFLFCILTNSHHGRPDL